MTDTFNQIKIIFDYIWLPFKGENIKRFTVFASIAEQGWLSAYMGKSSSDLNLSTTDFKIFTLNQVFDKASC